MGSSWWSDKITTSFERQLLLYLMGFSLVNALLIYGREIWDGYSVSLPEIILWQCAIWLLWYPCFRLMAITTSRMDRTSTLRNKLFFSGLSLGLLTLHYLWYFVLSDRFSPLNHLPNTGYGVYPYFFIFYFMIDLVIIWGLWGRLGAFKLVEEKPSPDMEEVITVKKGYNNILVPLEAITWVAAENYYARIFTVEDSYLVREPLKVLLDRLPGKEFVQIHRSTLVRRSYIHQFSHNDVVLKDGTIRRISKSGMKNLRESL